MCFSSRSRLALTGLILLLLAGALPAGRLYAVRLYETERNSAEYRGE